MRLSKEAQLRAITLFLIGITGIAISNLKSIINYYVGPTPTPTSLLVTPNIESTLTPFQPNTPTSTPTSTPFDLSSLTLGQLPDELENSRTIDCLEVEDGKNVHTTLKEVGDPNTTEPGEYSVFNKNGQLITYFLVDGRWQPWMNEGFYKAAGDTTGFVCIHGNNFGD